MRVEDNCKDAIKSGHLDRQGYTDIAETFLRLKDKLKPLGIETYRQVYYISASKICSVYSMH